MTRVELLHEDPSGMFQLVGNTRATKAWNPMNKETADATAIPNRILGNTVEQSILFAASTLIWTTYLTEASMKVIPVLVLTWAAGRVPFQFG